MKNMPKKIGIFLTLITAIFSFKTNFAQELKKQTTVLKKPLARINRSSRPVIRRKKATSSILKRTSTPSRIKTTSKFKKKHAPNKKPAPEIDSCPITPETIELRNEITKIGDDFGKAVNEETYNAFRSKLDRLHRVFIDATDIADNKRDISTIRDNALNQIKASIDAGKGDDATLDAILSRTYAAMKEKVTVSDDIIKAKIMRLEEEAAIEKRTDTLIILKKELLESQKALNQEKSPEKKAALKKSIEQLKDKIKILKAARSSNEIMQEIAEAVFTILFNKYTVAAIRLPIYSMLLTKGIKSLPVFMKSIKSSPVYTLTNGIVSANLAVGALGLFHIVGDMAAGYYDPRHPRSASDLLLLNDLRAIKEFAQLSGTCVKSTVISGVRTGCNYASGLFKWAKGKCISSQGFTNAILSEKPITQK